MSRFAIADSFSFEKQSARVKIKPQTIKKQHRPPPIQERFTLRLRTLFIFSFRLLYAADEHRAQG
jgi:hypothetical protein